MKEGKEGKEMKNTFIDRYTAIGLAEGFIEGTEEEIIKAWQYLVDTGICWKLQGSFGRRAMDSIESGVIKRPKELNSQNNIDYYGNVIFKGVKDENI